MCNSNHPHTLIRSWHTWIFFRVPVCVFPFFHRIRASQARFGRSARAVGGLGPSRQAAALPRGPTSLGCLGFGVHCFLRMDAGTCRPWYTLLEKNQLQIKLNLLQAKSSAKWRLVLATLLYIKHTFTRSLVPFAFPWVLHLSDLFALFHVPLPHPYHFHIVHVVFCFRPFRNVTLSTFSS